MSSGRTLALTVALCALGAAALPAQSVARYSAGTRRYHLISVVTRAEDRNGQHNEFKVTNEQIVSVALAAHGKDSLDFSYTMDSSSINSDPPITLPDISRMKGAQVHGVMGPTGKVFTYASTADKNDPDMQNLVEGMSRFLVVLPQNAKHGSTWTDTTRNTVEQNGAHLNLTSIVTSTIIDDTTFNGQTAWRVQRNILLSMGGTQSAMGQSVDIDGKGTGQGIYYLSTSGVYLGSTSTQNMQMMIKQKETGETVPVSQAVTSKVELIN